MIVRATLTHLDGRLFASGGTFASDNQVWPWVEKTICEQFDVEESAIGFDDLDRITINGEPKLTLFKKYRGKEKKFEQVELEPWRKCLLDAADYIEKNGWHQGSGGRDGKKLCVGLALQRAHTLNNTHHNDRGKSLRNFEDWIGPHVHLVRWNDAPERTKEEVISALRECARS